MGLVLFAVVVGYFVAGSIILAVIGYFVPRNSSGRKTALVFGIALFVMAWPVWIPLGTKILFETSCRFGNGGMHSIQPFQIDTFTFGKRSDLARLKWEGKSEFISSCDEYCIKELNRLFSKSTPWSAIRDTGTALEESWSYRDAPSKITSRLRHGRFWVAPSESQNCLAVLTDEKNNAIAGKCIAGYEIPTISAPFVVEFFPFTQPVDFGSSGGWKLMPSSMEWKWFSVSKHQSQLLRNGELVANYVWYDWNLIPYFGLAGNCPNESTPTHRTHLNHDEMFWRKLFP